MIELTEDQRQEIRNTNGGEIRARDPDLKTEYVLVQAEVYEQIRTLLEEAEDRAEQKAWLERATSTRRRWVQENPY